MTIDNKRRGLGSNLYRLGVADVVIQRILRHANVGNTTTYYIKMAAGDVQSAMTKLEENIPSANPTSEIVRDTYRDTNPIPPPCRRRSTEA